MPMTLHKFLGNHNINFEVTNLESCNYDSWYPINLYFFDFDCDYFTYFDSEVLDKICNKQLRVLFTYGEADDPFAIDKRLHKLASTHGIDRESIFFISGNTVADTIEGMSYLCESEYLFEQQNKTVSNLATANAKEKKYTCLNRIHKQYRKEFVWNLWNNDLIGNNYVSYGNVPNLDVRGDFNIINDNFITDQTKRISYVPNGFDVVLPLRADELTDAEHNNHSININHFHTNSYWNIAMETYIDAVGGTFLTEKTFKPIKHGQAFIILGTENSLALLKDQGYKTFDRWIDESYDTVRDVRLRWYAVFEETRKIALKSLEQLHLDYLEQLPIIHHNQEHFKRNKQAQLVKCLQRLTAQQ